MKTLLLSTLLLVCSHSIWSADQLVKIGVRAHSGVEKAIEKWQPTAQYLTDSISGYRFEITPFIALDEIHDAMLDKSVAFMLTNPSSYVDIEVNHGASRIATLKNKRGSEGYTRFGSIIFTRANRSDINELNDLKNKTFMSVSEQAFGGWRVALFEFLQQNINPYDDFSKLSYGKLQENVVHAVENGLVDAGTVRTDMLERMAETGEINIDDFKIINEQFAPGFNFKLSTELYPEWPFATLKHTPKNLAQNVAIALLTIDKTHPAAIAGKYEGWTVPLDYNKVHALLKNLKVEPYDIEKDISISEIVEFYWPWIILFIIVFILISAISAYLIHINRQLSITKKSLLHQIDDRKEAEKKLLEYRFQLEQIVNDRTSALAISNKELEAYSYSIAHDLRGPLRSITSFSQILLEDAGQKINKDEAELLSRIINAGKSMAGLIDDILELSKVTRADLHLSTVNLSNIANEIIERINIEAGDKKISWHISDKLKASADPKLALLLVQNLLVNACKFSFKKELPEIEFGTAKKENINVFFIKDNGIGIDNQYFDKIFKPFERLVKTEDFEGTGIGLATVQRIIERHNGKIWVESEMGVSTTFFFCFDCLEEP